MANKKKKDKVSIQEPKVPFKDKDNYTKHKLTTEEIDEVYQEDVRTVYSPEQVNTIGGTMGGTRGTLGSTRGDISGAPRGGILPQEQLGEQEEMIEYENFNNRD